MTLSILCSIPAIRLKLSDVMHDTVLSDSISSEMKTSELPEYYRAAVPFVKNYILYIHKTKTAHSPNGKIQINGIVRDFNISCEQFRSILETYKSKSCFALSELSGEGLLYVVPMHIDSAKETTQFLIFHIAPDIWAIAEIRDNNGQTVYRNEKIEEPTSQSSKCLFQIQIGNSYSRRSAPIPHSCKGASKIYPKTLRRFALSASYFA